MPRTRSALRLVLVLAVIALVPFVLSRLNPRPPSAPQATETPTPTAPIVVASPSPSYPPAVLGYDPPPQAASFVRAVELQTASLEGDPRPASILVVATTGAQALRAEPIAGQRAASLVVYLVVMKGDFALRGVDAHTTPLPAGHYSSALFDGNTLQLLGTGISDKPPAIPLSRLGRVLDVLPLSAPS